MKETIVEEMNVRVAHCSRWEGSWGASKSEKRTMTFNISVNDERTRGGFDSYDQDGAYYAEGGLWFKENELVDYDGVFTLSKTVLDQLIEWDFDVSDMMRVLYPNEVSA